MGQPPRNLRARTGTGRTARLAAVAVAALACLGAQTLPAAAADGAGKPSAPQAHVPSFYDPPAQLPEENGDLVRSEPLPLPLDLPGPLGLFPGEATRLMYKSTDSGGSPVAVTGAYIEPTAEWKGSGPRPVIALAPGTMGQGDQCAASLALEHPVSFDGRTVSVGYEDVAIHRLLSEGAAVVLTDYAGLGTTDRLHTYVDRRDGGHAVLDAVRAARKLEGASVGRDSRVGLYGYSQGGGATAAAAELQPSYAPEVELAGAYAGAPPADLAEVVKGIDGSALAGALGWSVNGFLQSDPSLEEVADRNINSEGRAAMKDLSTRCVGDAVLTHGFKQSKDWTKDGSSLSEIIAAEPKLQATLDDQRLGLRRPAAPVRVATGTQDDIVGHEQARQLAVDWCRKGADVTYEPVELPNLGDGLLTNHLAPLLVDQGEAVSWLTGRLRGRTAASECGTLGTQP